MSDEQVPNGLTPQGPVNEHGLLEEPPAKPEPASDEVLKAFNNRVWHEWNYAMSRFFEECEDKAKRAGLSAEDVHRALWRGYGSDVADEWTEWVEED